MTVTVRIPPSPTGYLQAGNGRMAVLNTLFAMQQGGRVLLRIDDTDDTRSKPEFEQAIVEDLAWLGLHHDVYARQSDRIPAYETAAERLKSSARLYPCYESAAELERRRKRQMAAGKPPIYDRAALKLSAYERAKFEEAGRRPHWRFLLSHKKVVWNDLIRGHVEIDTSTLSDPVLIREDGRFLYTLPSVVDDIDFEISHVIRGEDHVTNTAPQIEIFEALGASLPNFAHYPLFVTAGGEVLSKRLGSLSLRAMREEGIEPMAFVTYVAKIGTSDPVEPHLSLAALASEFAFEKIGRAPARFDFVELQNLNTRLLHALPYEFVAARLEDMGIAGDETFWKAVQPNLAKLSDAADLWRLIVGPVSPELENKALTAKAAELIPAEPWDETTWSGWTARVAKECGVTGRALFHPLRLALTGADHGPEMKKLLPLIGRARAVARLKGETA
jgi:glutamyl-tRNA synthetase